MNANRYTLILYDRATEKCKELEGPTTLEAIDNITMAFNDESELKNHYHTSFEGHPLIIYRYAGETRSLDTVYS